MGRDQHMHDSFVAAAIAVGGALGLVAVVLSDVFMFGVCAALAGIVALIYDRKRERSR